MKRILLALLALVPATIVAQIIDPVTWSSKIDQHADTATVTFTARILDSWHLYATELPEMDFGPAPTTAEFSTLVGAEPIGGLTASSEPIENYDEQFEANLKYWEHAVTLSQKFLIQDKEKWSIAGHISYSACNNKNCIPPSKFEFAFGDEQDATQPASIPYSGPSNFSFDPASKPWWTPVLNGGEVKTIEQASLWSIFLWGFLGGLLALFTPCVWPMIPLTVSFFLKKNSSRAKAIRQACIYGVSIVVIYLLLGLIITAIFGAGKLNDLSTNAVFNLIFFALLVVFAISFFGAFDIKLPSRWSNATDSRAESASGLLSIFFMAFTLALVSFSCTGPIIGTLLVEAATMGNIVGPAVGMGAFALALAIPFAIFALFPSMLKEMPRSGGWLNSVKIVLGFLELALSLKFLSVADLAYGWHILDREVFVALWIVIFGLLGLYLLGKIRFPHDAPKNQTGVAPFFLAIASISFAVYLVPGLWGAPLKSVSAFVPPLSTQDFNLYSHGEFQKFNDYEEGMRYAAENGMPVLVDFSGYGCVNCRKMEGAVFDTDEISSLLGKNFVIIELMVDDKKQLAEPFTVKENGKDVKITTVGEKWSFLQRHKFAANSQPFYMVLDNDGNSLSESYSYDEDINKFAKFLTDALEAYKKQ